MRTDQFMGLTQAAEEIVKDAVATPSGEHYIGMFGDSYPLRRYTLPDGTSFVEAVQADPWSSGPVFFLALKDERDEWVKESLWPEDEIERA